jgi:hypothetical protein
MQEWWELGTGGRRPWIEKDGGLWLSRSRPYMGCSTWDDDEKVKLSHYTPQRHMGGLEVQLYSFTTLALEGGGWSMPCPCCFTPRKNPLPILQQAGWVSRPVWTVHKNSPTPGFKSQTIQHIVSRCTDYITLAAISAKNCKFRAMRFEY